MSKNAPRATQDDILRKRREREAAEAIAEVEKKIKHKDNKIKTMIKRLADQVGVSPSNLYITGGEIIRKEAK